MNEEYFRHELLLRLPLLEGPKESPRAQGPNRVLKVELGPSASGVRAHVAFQGPCGLLSPEAQIGSPD